MSKTGFVSPSSAGARDAAAVASWRFGGDELRRRRGQDLDIPRGRLGASRRALATGARRFFNASYWPACVIVGLDLTSRRGQAKLAERRTRGAADAAAALATPAGAWTVHDSLAELGRLCETARVRVADSTYQRLELANGQYLVGKGKIEDVAARVIATNSDAVVFDDELTLAQQRSILAELEAHGCRGDVQVLDRTQLVLQIFSERAQTREARAQIALARAESRGGVSTRPSARDEFPLSAVTF